MLLPVEVTVDFDAKEGYVGCIVDYMLRELDVRHEHVFPADGNTGSLCVVEGDLPGFAPAFSFTQVTVYLVGRKGNPRLFNLGMDSCIVGKDATGALKVGWKVVYVNEK